MLTWLLLSPFYFSSPTTLPTVSLENFHPGQTWVWDYSDVNGHLYSTEHYTLLEVKGSKLLFEMSTEFPNRTAIPHHHRFIADLKACLTAYRNSAQPEPWSIDLWTWDRDRWVSVGLTPPLAFEEKFNCNPYPGSSDWQHPVKIRRDSRPPLFQHQKKTAPNRSWYALEGPLEGLAVEKDFVQGGQITYRFRLRTPASPPPELALEL